MLVRYHVGVSLDGFIAPKDGSTKWLEPYGKVGWGFMQTWVKQIGGVIMGRATYDHAAEMRAAGSPSVLGAWPALVMTSRPIDDLPKGIEASNGSPSAGVARLKARMERGDIWLFGGGVTAGRFLQDDAIDMIELAVIPVALGEGLPLFAGVSVQRTFEHVLSKPIGEGCFVNTWRKVGAMVCKGELPAQGRAATGK
jgi:dihydrofolate reductase